MLPLGGPIRVRSESVWESQRSPRRCFRCQGLGHIASECPNKKMITLAEFEEGDNSYAIDPTVESVVMIDYVVEEVVGPDEGACLVVRRTLSNTPDREELLQQDAIFHARRPWLFDCQMMHDGYKNTYFFNHNDRRIVLTPMSPASTPIKHQPLSALLKAEQHEYYSIKDFILLGLDESEPKPPATLHPRIQPLLQSYNHVFPVEIPSGLPPLRTIQHKIDLIPGSIDLRSGYHQIRIYKGDEWKTAFKTKEGSYEWLFMPTEHDHQYHLQQLFEVLDQERLYGNLDKCEFFTDQVTFLGYLVSAHGVGIGAVLLQLGRPIAYFSEKLNDTKQRYSTYDKEFYAIVRAVDHWQHYLISKEFILHSDHEALKYIQGQHKLRPRHAKWVEYLQAFTFTIKHRSGKLNKGTDALSRKYALVNSLHTKVVRLELLSQNYPTDPDFGELFSSCQLHATEHYVKRCLPCHRAKSQLSPYGLYMPLPVPNAPWEYVNLDFIVGLPRTQCQKDFIMVVVDRFSKMAHFIACHTTFDAVQVAALYLKEIIRLHGIPLSMTEVTNRTLESLLRSLIKTNLKQWEELLPQAEFAYNRTPNKTTGHIPFMVVYGLNPATPLDLIVLDTLSKFNQAASDRATDIKALHQLVHDKISKSNELIKYRRDKGRKHILFQPGDLVWVHFRKDRFPAKRRSKLSPRSEGPFKILTKVNDNAYKVDLPGTPTATATFNVTDL
nr:hypothetical protein [Tanacetum cinerariifolium]